MGGDSLQFATYLATSVIYDCVPEVHVSLSCIRKLLAEIPTVYTGHEDIPCYSNGKHNSFTLP